MSSRLDVFANSKVTSGFENSEEVDVFVSVLDFVSTTGALQITFYLWLLERCMHPLLVHRNEKLLCPTHKIMEQGSVY